MRAARIVALLLAAALAAFLVWTATRPPSDGSSPDDATGPGTRSPTTKSPADDWDLAGGGRRGETPSAAGPGAAPGERKAIEVLPEDVVPVGTPTKPGQEVPVALPWRTGAGAMRYEITDTSQWRDQNDPRARNDTQRTYRISLEVVEGDGVEGDGTGGARIRLTIDSIREQALAPDGRIWDFDSRVGDRAGLLDDPIFGPPVKATLPTLGRMIEFRLDAAGRVVDLDGVDEWRRLYLDATQGLDPAVRLAAPTPASVIARWSEYLFPPLGGKTIVAGTPRPFLLRQPLLPPWDLLWKGRLDAAADDPDAFRVEVFADPVPERGSGAETDLSAGVAKIHASHGKDPYRAWWRFARTGVPGLLEGRIDARFSIWVSREAGRDEKGGMTYAPTFAEGVRRAIIRRTHPAPGVK